MSGAGMRDVVPPKAFSLEVGLELLEPPRDCPLDTAADELGVTSRTDRSHEEHALANTRTERRRL